MVVEIIDKNKIEEYVKKRPATKKKFASWNRILTRSNGWKSIDDLLDFYKTAKEFGNNAEHIAFFIGGDTVIKCKPMSHKSTLYIIVEWIGPKVRYRLNCLTGLW